jgi:hypothetical protein
VKTGTKTTLIIAATLLIGIVIGALGSGFFIHRSIRHFEEREHQEVFVDRMISIIEPNPDQEAVIREILTRHAEEFEQRADAFHEETSALFDSLRTELDSVLTDQQKARLEERGKKMRSFMKHGGPPRHRRPGEGPPPPPPPEETGR